MHSSDRAVKETTIYGRKKFIVRKPAADNDVEYDIHQNV